MILRSTFSALVLCSSLLPAQTAVVNGKKPARNDAAVVSIMVPSDDPRYAANNPAVHEARIIIRNNGTDPLHGISVRYGTEGFLPRMFAWTGNLVSGASAEVKLPQAIDMRSGSNTFTVVLGDPNGRKDKVPVNNTLSTTFTAAPLYGSPVTVRLRTRAGTSGLLRLESIRGPILIERTWDGTRDSLFTETAELTSGSYIVTLVDSGGTNASARIIAADGGVIKVLHSAPKGGTVHQFRVDVGAVSEVEAITDAELLLLPGRGHAMVDVHAAEKVSVVVKDGTGSPVWERHVPEKKPSSYPIDLSAQPTGSYEVILVRKGEETSLGRIDLFDNGPR